jgi:hypothetical protein
MRLGRAVALRVLAVSAVKFDARKFLAAVHAARDVSAMQTIARETGIEWCRLKQIAYGEGQAVTELETMLIDLWQAGKTPGNR